MSGLPGKENCLVDKRKVTEYLLNTSRTPGAAKARFFLSCGFREDDWAVLAEALKAHGQANGILNEVVSDYGTKYEVEGPLTGPDGRSPTVRTV